MKRAYEPLLKEYLKAFPCVGVIGPRQCGKTTLLGSLPKAWRRFDLERAADHQVIAHDPELFLRLHPRQVAIDEAQFLPELFPALRVAIDAMRREPGRFIVTGSSSPRLLKSISETLAGRIGIIEMAPFAWSEVHRAKGPTLASLLADRKSTASDVAGAIRPRGTVVQAHDYWFRGGYPEPWIRRTVKFRNLWMDQYFRTYLFRDVARLFPGLDEAKFRLFLQMLGGLSGSIINYSDVARSLGVSYPTVRDYIEIAHGTFVWRRLPPYEKSAMKRIVKHPKGHLRDSGLLHHLLTVPNLEALLAHPQAGRSWEGMVTEEICRQLTCHGASFDSYYYRTSAGAEVDLVLEGDFGLVPVEIKRSQAVEPREIRALGDFVAERGCRMGIVVNNDQSPRLYARNIVGVPFTHL
ncbi:MAG: ATP-binding protein [Phycisphaerae bacterium]